MEPTTPSTPAPDTRALVCSLLRSGLLIASTLGMYSGVASDASLMLVSGAIVAVGTAGWSLVDKYQAAEKQHKAAIMSARLALPVVPTT